MRLETLCPLCILDFDRTKHRMGHERRKTVVGVFERDLQNVFAKRARAEWRRCWRGLRWFRVCRLRSCAFDIREQFGVRRERVRSPVVS